MQILTSINPQDFVSSFQVSGSVGRSARKKADKQLPTPAGNVWGADRGMQIKCREVRQKKGGQATPDTSREMMKEIRNIILLSGPPRHVRYPAFRTSVLTTSCQQASEGNGVLYFSFAVESGSGSRWDPAVRTFVLTVSCQQASGGKVCFTFRLLLSRVLGVVGIRLSGLSS